MNATADGRQTSTWPAGSTGARPAWTRRPAGPISTQPVPARRSRTSRRKDVARNHCPNSTRDLDGPGAGLTCKIHLAGDGGSEGLVTGKQIESPAIRKLVPYEQSSPSRCCQLVSASFPKSWTRWKADRPPCEGTTRRHALAPDPVSGSGSCGAASSPSILHTALHGTGARGPGPAPETGTRRVLLSTAPTHETAPREPHRTTCALCWSRATRRSCALATHRPPCCRVACGWLAVPRFGDGVLDLASSQVATIAT